MKSYQVTWVIDIDADSPLEAAQQALAYQRDPTSTATVFDVVEFDPEEMATHGDVVRVDLLDLLEESEL